MLFCSSSSALSRTVKLTRLYLLSAATGAIMAITSPSNPRAAANTPNRRAIRNLPLVSQPSQLAGYSWASSTRVTPRTTPILDRKRGRSSAKSPHGEDAHFQLMAWDETEVQYGIGTTVFHFPIEELNRPVDPSIVLQNWTRLTTPFSLRRTPVSLRCHLLGLESF